MARVRFDGSGATADSSAAPNEDDDDEEEEEEEGKEALASTSSRELDTNVVEATTG